MTCIWAEASATLILSFVVVPYAVLCNRHVGAFLLPFSIIYSALVLIYFVLCLLTLVKLTEINFEKLRWNDRL